MPSARGVALWALCCASASAAAGDRSQDAAALVQSAVLVHREAGDEQPPPETKTRAAAAKGGAASKKPPAKAAARKTAGAAGPAAKAAPKAAAAAKAAAAKAAPKAASAAPKAARVVEPKATVAVARSTARASLSTLNARGTGDAKDGSVSMHWRRAGDACEDNCPLTWGDQVDLQFSVDLPTGLQPGDQVTSRWTFKPNTLSQENALSSVLLTDALKMASVCDICEGSCKHELVWGNIGVVRASMPTHLYGATYCDEQGRVKAGAAKIPVLSDGGLRVTPGLGRTIEELSGNLSYELTVLRKDGKRRASALKTALLVPKGGARRSTSLAQVSARSFRALGGAVRNVRQLLGPLELAKAYFEVVASAASEAAASLPQGAMQLNLVGSQTSDKASAAADTVFVHKVTFLDMEKGTPRNHSWTATGCETVDRRGSVSCRFPLGEPFESEMNIHLAATLEEGSVMKIKLLPPKIDGFMGSMLKNVWKTIAPSDIKFPLCGPATDVKVMGETFKVAEARCGYTSLDVVQPPHTFNMLSRDMFKNLYMPGNIKFPEIALKLVGCVSTSVQVLHADGRVVLDAIVETGTERGGR